jgi:formylglycine-generating enzyme required for sulfatase activity
LPVAEGVVLLGLSPPYRKVTAGPFAIAETEVTNEQYREFIEESGQQAPPYWQDRHYPVGTANEPVTMVTWQQAGEYCAWLSRKIEGTVRLPTEAEWELAARGENDFKYPWGNDWNERAAASVEGDGQVRAVRSYPAGRSPVGAYDLAGNVWEWVSDDVLDREGRPMIKDGSLVKIAKGGSANEPKSFIGTRARALLPADKPRRHLGFRYVVTRRNIERSQ